MSSEIVKNKTIDLLQELHLAEIDLQWIDDAIASNFCDIDGLPTILEKYSSEKKFFVETLNELRLVSKSWYEIEDTNGKFQLTSRTR